MPLFWATGRKPEPDHQNKVRLSLSHADKSELQELNSFPFKLLPNSMSGPLPLLPLRVLPVAPSRPAEETVIYACDRPD